ncbi:hypothetical protein MTO96_014962 [Rhipicephalus appendiculatus]
MTKYGHRIVLAPPITPPITCLITPLIAPPHATFQHLRARHGWAVSSPQSRAQHKAKCAQVPYLPQQRLRFLGRLGTPSALPTLESLQPRQCAHAVCVLAFGANGVHVIEA